MLTTIIINLDSIYFITAILFVLFVVIAANFIKQIAK